MKRHYIVPNESPVRCLVAPRWICCLRWSSQKESVSSSPPSYGISVAESYLQTWSSQSLGLGHCLLSFDEFNPCKKCLGGIWWWLPSSWNAATSIVVGSWDVLVGLDELGHCRRWRWVCVVLSVYAERLTSQNLSSQACNNWSKNWFQELSWLCKSWSWSCSSWFHKELIL